MTIFNVSYDYHKTKNSRICLIFLHAWTYNKSSWKEVYKDLKKDYSILSFDFIGHGESDKPLDKKYHTLEYQSRVLDYLKTKLDIKKFVLIGHSLGGMVAIHHELTRKASSGLVLLSSSSNLKMRKYVINHPILKKYKDSILKKINIVYKKEAVDLTKNKNSLLHTYFDGLKNTPIPIVVSFLEEIMQADYSQKIKNITKPCLIIHGKKDFLIPYSDSILMSARIKTSKIFLIDEANHFPNITHPQIVGEKIRVFLKDL